MRYAFEFNAEHGRAAVSKHVDTASVDMLPNAYERDIPEIAVGVTVNHNEEFDEIFDGVQLELERFNIQREDAAENDFEGAITLRLKALLSWQEVERLSEFLGFIVQQNRAGLLKMKIER